MKTIEEIVKEEKQSLEDAILQLSFAAKEMTLLMQNISQKMIEISEQMKQFQYTSMCITSNEVSGDGSGESLPEVSQEDHDSDGWIEWGGGKCPVLENVKVYVRFASGKEDRSPFESGYFRWSHHGWANDIIAYRIVK